LRAVELFCGYGGASEGIVRAGLEYEVGYDIWPTVIAAHRAWHPKLRVDLRDGRDVGPEELEGCFRMDKSALLDNWVPPVFAQGIVEELLNGKKSKLSEVKR